MKIGFVNDFYSEERVALASKLGFDTMEIMVDYEHNLDKYFTNNYFYFVHIPEGE